MSSVLPVTPVTPIAPFQGCVTLAEHEKLKLECKRLKLENEEIKASHADTVELLAIALKRITQIENAIFSKDPEGEIIRDQNKQPVVSPILTIATESHAIKLASEPSIIPKTTLESKAVALVEHLKEVKPRNGEVFMNSREIINFLRFEISDELKTNDSNMRRAKKDVITKARKLFYETVIINKSKFGRRETVIVYNPPYGSD